MATHRPHDTGLAPEFDFRLTLAVLEAFERSDARHRPVTPDALARLLSARPSGARPTATQIRDALAQVQRWREHILTRDLLQHRQQLVAMSAELEGQRRRLDEDRVYLTRMLRQIDALLRNSLTVPDGAETAARPGARRALQ